MAWNKTTGIGTITIPFLITFLTRFFRNTKEKKCQKCDNKQSSHLKDVVELVKEIKKVG